MSKKKFKGQEKVVTTKTEFFVQHTHIPWEKLTTSLISKKIIPSSFFSPLTIGMVLIDQYPTDQYPTESLAIQRQRTLNDYLMFPRLPIYLLLTANSHIIGSLASKA